MHLLLWKFSERKNLVAWKTVQPTNSLLWFPTIAIRIFSCFFLCFAHQCHIMHAQSLFNLVYLSRFRWLIKAAMRPVGPFDSSPSFAQHNDCVLVVGVSRPKLAAVFLTIMIISLFLTFHVLYDSAIYSIQVKKISTLMSCWMFVCVLVNSTRRNWTK